MTQSRRRLLGGLAGVATAALAGCAGTPAGPTDGVTAWRRRALDTPTVPRPAEPSDDQTLALRSFLDTRVTTAEPLFRATSESAVGDRQYDDLRWGVPAVRDWLAESAGDPRSMDHGFAVSRVSYVGWALGFLRVWHGVETTAQALGRARRASEAVDRAAAAMPRDCAAPARYLARVGWAERRLKLGRVAVDQYDDGGAAGSADGRLDQARLGARHTEQAAKANWWARSARHYAADYVDERSGDVAPFGEALAANREAVLADVDASLPDREAAEAFGDDAEDEVVADYRRRLGNPLGHAREEAAYARVHADRDIAALAAVEAGRALCHLRGFERARDGLDPDRLADGVAPATLFEPKRRVVRQVREYVDGSDPLVSWLASEPARLLFAGEVYLEPDTPVDSRATGRAVCLAFYRHALGYAAAIPDVAARLERR
jgi:hypothetical protein